MASISEEDNGTKKRTIADFEKIRDNLEDAVRAELDLICQKILQTAIDLCPKDTGALASSINMEGGAISSSSSAGGNFYEVSFYAGSPDIINPKTGIPTAEYALFVHDGHAMPNGMFYSGVPFLSDALALFEDEIQSAIDRALSELKANTVE